jgi:hypothetical protein
VIIGGLEFFSCWAAPFYCSVTKKNPNCVRLLPYSGRSRRRRHSHSAAPIDRVRSLPPQRPNPAPSSRTHCIWSSSRPASVVFDLIDPWRVDCVAGSASGWDGVVGVRASVYGPALRAAGPDAAQAVEGANRRQHGVPLLLEPGDKGYAVRASRRCRACPPIAAACLLQAR